MAEATDNHDAAIVVKQSKILWILVFAIIWLAYSVGQVPLMIEKILHRESMTLQKIVDRRYDDANDNYKESLNLLLQGKGAYDILQAFQCDLSKGETLLKAQATREENQMLDQMQEDMHGGHGELH
mgnify:CR=1 FL=1